MKQQTNTKCLDILVELMNHPPLKHPKTIVRLIGQAIKRYEEERIIVPKKYYEIYQALVDKYNMGKQG